MAGVDYAFAEFVCRRARVRSRTRLACRGARRSTRWCWSATALLNHVGIRVVTVLERAVGLVPPGRAPRCSSARCCWLAPLQPASFLLDALRGAAASTAFTLSVLRTRPRRAVAGAVDLHRLRRLGARRRGDGGRARGGAARDRQLGVGLGRGRLRHADGDHARDPRSAGDGRGAENPFIYVLVGALGGRLGGALVWMVIGAMWFCGLSSVTSNSRMLFAFARDGGAPGSRRLARVSERFRTPDVRRCGPASAIAFALALWSRAYSVIVSISTIGLYASYGLPIWLRAGARGARRGSSAGRGTSGAGRRWSTRSRSAGSRSSPCCSCCRRTSAPGTPSPALLVLLAVYDLAWARTRFRGRQRLKSLARPAIPSRPTDGSES